MDKNITLTICNYNSSSYIKETLKYITKQTFNAFKILIIDDCSTDDSVEMIDQILKKTSIEYTIIKLNKNNGIAHARQVALEKSNTKYIIFIDSDDLIHEELLEKQYKIISQDFNIIGVNTWLNYINEASKPIKGGFYLGSKTKDDFISKARKGKLIFMPIQCLFDRQAAIRVGGFRQIGFPEGKPRYQDFCEDLDLWTRMSDLYVEGKYMITIPEVLYSYRKTGLGLSSNRLLMMLKMKFVKINLKRRRRGDGEISFNEFLNSYTKQDMLNLEKEAEVATLLGNGAFLFNSGRILEGMKLVLLSFIKDPSYLWQKILANTRLFK